MEQPEPKPKSDDVPLKAPIRVIVTGATGTLGAEVLDQCLTDPRISAVTAIVRKDLNISHPKLNVVTTNDFNDYSKIEDKISGHDACYWCLGVSTSKVSNETLYREITLEYTLSAAKAMSKVNPNFNFFFVSGEGADPSMKSRMLFARVKGEAEVRLAELGLPRALIFRPGYIKPLRERPFSTGEKILNFLGGVVASIAPSTSTNGVEVARAFFWASFNPVDKSLFLNKDIKKLAALETPKLSKDEEVDLP